tara:strand:+ start:853 stop:987 length:135 start_codon:yes stop_codon:yes gene_type:complete
LLAGDIYARWFKSLKLEEEIKWLDLRDISEDIYTRALELKSNGG